MYSVIEIFMLKKEKLMKVTYVILTSFICDGNIPLKSGSISMKRKFNWNDSPCQNCDFEQLNKIVCWLSGCFAY